MIKLQIKAIDLDLIYKRHQIIKEKFPPSDYCSCNKCNSFCIRPGWWTVYEAYRAIEQGYKDCMMLEISPDFSFGVLSPSFKGNESQFAFQEYKKNGCRFFINGLCDLHNSGLTPLECRYCHHDRIGSGQLCHNEIEKDWKTKEGQLLIKEWCSLVNLINKCKK